MLSKGTVTVLGTVSDSLSVTLSVTEPKHFRSVELRLCRPVNRSLHMKCGTIQKMIPLACDENNFEFKNCLTVGRDKLCPR